MNLKSITLAAAFTLTALTAKPEIMDNTVTSLAPAEQLTLTSEWDKVFPKSDKVDHHKVTFVNRYGITLAADMYTPRGATAPLPAIAVSGPFGAVKEQSSGLYAQQLAERGFLTIAFDPSFTGESGGQPRRVASPDINVEDFSAAVDYLSTLPEVDPDRIGILGVCGWGGIAIQAAINDPRIKATVASTMYDMTRVSANGYFDADNSAEKRNAARAALAAQRTADYRAGSYQRAGGVVDPLPDDAPQFVKDYHAYYKTPRGFHPRSGNSTDGWNMTSVMPFMNFKFFEYAGELESAVMIVHGENAHSRYFGEDTFKLLHGDNKELLIVADASHCDLYDNLDKIPMNQIAAFFTTYLPVK
ncbi:MAG: alpha/beta hydrolase [Muribaculaceae bacterium]|nr:alpha/beta hydrolase [Muribaculaceae bacterium]